MVGAKLHKGLGIFLLQNPSAAGGGRHGAEKFEGAIRRLGLSCRTNVFQYLRQPNEDGWVDFLRVHSQPLEKNLW